jgi:hypothetical protein
MQLACFLQNARRQAVSAGEIAMNRIKPMSAYTGLRWIHAKAAGSMLTMALLTAGLSQASQASILVGTFVESQAETIVKVNQLIDDYNADFGASLPQVVALLDKLEGVNSAGFTEGNLQLSDFNFYAQNDDGTKTESIFDASVNFDATPIDFTVDGFNDLDNPVMGFEQLAGASFDYYVSKDGNLGWSLWTFMDDFNPVYTDAGTGNSSISGSDFTKGSIADNSLAYDPIGNGISHISFYTTAASDVPEPASLGLFGLAITLVALRRGRRSGWRG